MHCGIIWKTDTTYITVKMNVLSSGGSETSVQKSLVEIKFFNYGEQGVTVCMNCACVLRDPSWPEMTQHLDRKHFQ